MVFKRSGPAISSLGRAVSPGGGGGGYKPGDVVLFPPDRDPGSGWLSEDAEARFMEQYKGVVVPRIGSAAAMPEFGVGSHVIEAGGGVVLALGVGSSVPAAQSKRSEDGGDTWIETPRPAPGKALRGLHYSPRLGMWLAFGTDASIWASVDSARTWTQATNHPFLGVEAVFTAAELDGLLFVASANSVAVSSDGLNWDLCVERSEFAGGTLPAFVSLSEANGKIFAIFHAGPSDRRIYTTEDGEAWTLLPNPMGAGVGGTVVYFNGQYYTSAGMNVYASTDLVSWREEPLPRPTTASNVSRLRVLDGVFAVTFNYLNAGYAGAILASVGGEEWKDVTGNSIAGGQQSNSLCVTHKYIFFGVANAAPRRIPIWYSGVPTQGRPPSKINWKAYTKL